MPRRTGPIPAEVIPAGDAGGGEVVATGGGTTAVGDGACVSTAVCEGVGVALTDGDGPSAGGAGAKRSAPSQAADPTRPTAATPTADSTACRRARRRRTTRRRPVARAASSGPSVDSSCAARFKQLAPGQRSRRTSVESTSRTVCCSLPRDVVPSAASSRAVPSAVYRLTAPSLSPRAAAVSRTDRSSTCRSTTQARSRGLSVCSARDSRRHPGPAPPRRPERRVEIRDGTPPHARGSCAGTRRSTGSPPPGGRTARPAGPT